MRRKALVGLCLTTLVAASAQGALVGVAGPASNAGTLPTIISAPSNVLNSVAFNTGQEGFNEKQGVLLAAAITTDQGSISPGTMVDSHMIFLNKHDDIDGTLSHQGVTWTFDGIVLGTMTDTGGSLEAASNTVLGNIPGTAYPGAFANRGLEGGDNLTFVANTLTLGVGMQVTQPGDWIRVVTATIPEPGSLAVWTLLGLWAIVGTRRKIRVK